MNTFQLHGAWLRSLTPLRLSRYAYNSQNPTAFGIEELHQDHHDCPTTSDVATKRPATSCKLHRAERRSEMYEFDRIRWARQCFNCKANDMEQMVDLDRFGRLYLVMMKATLKKFRSRSDHHSNCVATVICGGE